MNLQPHEIERMARTLAEADGNDPDRLMFQVQVEKVRGREGYFVPPSDFCFPAWKAYRALAIEALANQMELTV